MCEFPAEGADLERRSPTLLTPDTLKPALCAQMKNMDKYRREAATFGESKSGLKLGKVETKKGESRASSLTRTPEEFIAARVVAVRISQKHRG